MSKHFVYSCYERDTDEEIIARVVGVANQIVRWHQLATDGELTAYAALEQCLSDAQSILKVCAVPEDGVEVRIHYNFHPYQPERGPSYASGGEPSEPAMVEFDRAETEVDGKWVPAPELAEWAEAELQGRCNDDAMRTAAEDEIDARESAAEARAEMRAEDNRMERERPSDERDRG